MFKQKKSMFILIAAIALCAIMLCACGEPKIVTSGDWQYVKKSDGTLDIQNYTGSEADLEIPTEIDGMTVTSIGVSWVTDDNGDYVSFTNSSLRNLTIPDTIVEINESFNGCDLESISVSAENSAYCDVDGVLFTKDMTEIISYPSMKFEFFYEIPSGVKIIGYEAFCGKKFLDEVIIPDGVTEIGASAFSMCTALKNVNIPESVTSIEHSAFSMCYSLESITIPANVQEIGDYAFDNCSLTSINVSAENSAYCDVDGVLYTKDMKTLIQYPGGKTDTTYEIPNSVTAIERAAINYTSLTKVTVPDSVEVIDSYNFQGSPLTSIDVSEGNSAYCDVDGVLYTKDMTELIKYPDGKTDSEFEIPSEVATVAAWAFDCEALESLTIPKSVKTIESYAIGTWNELTIYYEGDLQQWDKIAEDDYDEFDDITIIYGE